MTSVLDALRMLDPVCSTLPASLTLTYAYDIRRTR
jgi:hypothetical protein